VNVWILINCAVCFARSFTLSI